MEHSLKTSMGNMQVFYGETAGGYELIFRSHFIIIDHYASESPCEEKSQIAAIKLLVCAELNTCFKLINLVAEQRG